MESTSLLLIRMDSIKNIFTKEKKDKSAKSSDDSESETMGDIPVIEVAETKESKRVGEIEPIIVKSVDLTSLVDIQEVTSELRNGNIIILNISPLMDEDPAELKRAVDQLKGVAADIGGDVGRLSESRIIATPELVQIQFREKA